MLGNDNENISICVCFEKKEQINYKFKYINN